MDKCPAELVVFIFELACAEDLGHTARTLGLVSKHFRAFAEPIELRSISVSGIEQLVGAIARLDKAKARARARAATTPYVEGRENVIVRHLFISELTKEHAILADTVFGSDIFGHPGIFWYTEEGRNAQRSYFERRDEFWRSAAELVQKAGLGLRTLFLLSSSNWFSWKGSSDLDRLDPLSLDTLDADGRVWRMKYSREMDRPNVLGVLSGINLPNLVTLTINHDAASEIRSFGDNGSLFKPPSFPALRRLHIVSCVYTDENAGRNETPKHAHPLLACLLTKFANVEQLVLFSWDMRPVENTIRAIFGPDWEELLSGGKLPGNLRSVVLRKGKARPRSSALLNIRRRSLGEFINRVVQLGIPGLEAKPPNITFPKSGEREYELLLSEWKEQCLGLGK